MLQISPLSCDRKFTVLLLKGPDDDDDDAQQDEGRDVFINIPECKVWRSAADSASIM